jgi:hypothetical protein
MIVDRPLPATETPRAEAAVSPSPAAAGSARLALLLALLGLMVLATGLRLAGLRGTDGRLTIDEARLVLVADGVLRTGLPTLPTERLYTRGLLPSYLVAGSFAAFGRSDFAARLPSVVAGVLLVPATFLLGRLLAGSPAGLLAAAFTALAWPLIDWSRQAWMPMPFLLLFCLTVYCWYRGFVCCEARWQVVGAAALLLAVLTYEFAVLVVVGLGLFLALEVGRGRRDWYRGRATLAALGLVALGLALLAGLAVALRSGTLAGPLGEVAWWFSPDLTNLAASHFYFDRLLAPYSMLLSAALIGFIPLLRAQPRGAAFLGLLAALAFFVPSFLLQVKQTDRYGLPFLLLVAVLAAAGTVAIFRSNDRPRLARLGAALPILGLLTVFLVALRDDLQAIPSRLATRPPAETWVRVLGRQDIGPNDLIAAEQPEKLQHYAGRVEFFLRLDDHQRYVYPAGDRFRHIYTGATMIQSQADFERLVEAAYPERTLWVVGRRDPTLDTLNGIEPGLGRALRAVADRYVETRDGWVLFSVRLPRQQH